MPKYAIKDPISGTSVKVEAARKPTQAEALAFLSKRQANLREEKEAQSPGFAEAQAANEAAKQANLEQVLGGIPFRGATEAAKQAYQASTDLAGQGFVGNALGTFAGGGAALVTVFNPLSKALANLSNIYRSAGENLAANVVGGENPAQQLILGEQEAQPFFKVPDTESTAANLGAMGLNFAQVDPANTAAALTGLIEGARSPGRVVRSIAAPIESAIKAAPSAFREAGTFITPNFVKRGAEIIAQVPDAFKKNVGRTAQDVFRPTTDTAKAELNKDIQSGALHDDLRNISEFGKPTTAEGMLENGLIATDNLITLHNDFVAQFPDEVVSTSDISSSIRKDASKGKFKKQATRDALNEFADKFDGQDTLQGSFETLQELNEMRRAYYEKSERGQLTDQDNALHEAEQKARDLLSTKLDNFYQLKTKATDNPYRQYGSLKGRLDDLTRRMNSLLTERGIEVSKGLSLDREVLATVKKNISLLKGGEKGRIDNRISRMFDLLDKEPTTNLRDLTPEEIQTLQQEKIKADRQAESADPKDLNDYLKKEAALLKNIENKDLAEAIKLEVERAIAMSENEKVRKTAEALGFFK